TCLLTAASDGINGFKKKRCFQLSPHACFIPSASAPIGQWCCEKWDFVVVMAIGKIRGTQILGISVWGFQPAKQLASYGCTEQADWLAEIPKLVNNRFIPYFTAGPV